MEFANGVAHSFQSHIGQVAHGGDDSLWVEFHTVAVPNPWETKQQGRPIFEEKVFIKIIIPGKRQPDIYDQEATEEDKARFPRHWQAFLQSNGASSGVIGTPIESLASLGKGRIAELKASQIHTVDQLAALHDGQLGVLGMGGRELVEQAKAFLQAAHGFSSASSATAENERLKEEIAEMRAQMSEILAFQTKRKRGRPRKEEETEIDEQEIDDAND